MENNQKVGKIEKRCLQILEILAATPIRTITNLAEELQVSDETIRKDLKSKYLKDKVIQTHGSVALNNSLSGTGIPFEFRKSVNHEIKNELAKRACAMILPGNVVVIEHNTIGFLIVQNIVLHPELISTITLITNSFSILSFLVEMNIHIRIIFLGGAFVYDQLASYDFSTVNQMKVLHGDIAFLCPAAINDEFLITAYDENELNFKSTIIKNCKTSVLIADQGKYGKLALRNVNTAADYDFLLTDIQFNDSQKELLQSFGTQLIEV